MIEKVIKRARKDYPQAIIFGVKFYPATDDNPDEWEVFGGCSLEEWKRAVLETDPRKGINHFKLAIYRQSDLINFNQYEKFKWEEGSRRVCWECGELFPTENLLKEANEHEKKYPGFRRAFSRCPNHNYGAVALFPRDCEY